MNRRNLVRDASTYGYHQRCGPCQRTGPRIVLSESFYDQPVLSAALVDVDFDTVLRAVRDARNGSQETLAEFLGLDQDWISRLDTGKRHLLNLRVVVAADTPPRSGSSASPRTGST